MTDPFNSSSWTGPVDRATRVRPGGIFTHDHGHHQVTSDYARVAAAQADADHRARHIPAEVRRVVRLAAWLLLLCPVILCGVWLVVDWLTPGITLQDNRHLLLGWGCPVAALGFWQLGSRSTRLVPLRMFLVCLALLATIAVAGLYGYAGITAYRNAEALPPERVFYFGTKDDVNYQRADGSNVIGSGRRAPMPYGHCATIQQLKGQYGFAWARILERPAPRGSGQLAWPTRREDCFSDKPLDRSRG